MCVLQACSNLIMTSHRLKRNLQDSVHAMKNSAYQELGFWVCNFSRIFMPIFRVSKIPKFVSPYTKFFLYDIMLEYTQV